MNNPQYEFEDFLEDDDDDVIIRLQQEDGTTVTFITAPESVFDVKEKLEPLVYGMGEGETCVVFNGDLFEQMIEDSVEKNGAIYGAQASAFLPITMLLHRGVKAVDRYLKEQK